MSIEFKKLDLRDFNNCLKVTKNKDIVFNLAGVKGSPKMTKEKQAGFFVPTLTFSVNIMTIEKAMLKLSLPSSVEFINPEFSEERYGFSI